MQWCCLTLSKAPAVFLQWLRQLPREQWLLLLSNQHCQSAPDPSTSLTWLMASPGRMRSPSNLLPPLLLLLSWPGRQLGTSTGS
jgi:hypothetical protein